MSETTTILGAEPSLAESAGPAASTAKSSLATRRSSLRRGRAPPFVLQRDQWDVWFAFRRAVLLCRGLTVLWLAFRAVWCVGAARRALLWASWQVRGTTGLVDPAANVISSLIGAQGIGVSQANGSVP